MASGRSLWRGWLHRGIARVRGSRRPISKGRTRSVNMIRKTIKADTRETGTTLTGRCRRKIPAASTGSPTRTIKTIRTTRTRRSDHHDATRGSTWSTALPRRECCEQWRAAFLAVPREVFIPEVIWRYAGDDLVPLRRCDDPEEWLRRVYGPRYVVTQVDDGTPAGPTGAAGCRPVRRRARTSWP